MKEGLLMGGFSGEVEGDAVEKKVGVYSSVVDADEELQSQGWHMRIEGAPPQRSVLIAQI